jgi:hypothetical protein
MSRDPKIEDCESTSDELIEIHGGVDHEPTTKTEEEESACGTRDPP